MTKEQFNRECRIILLGNELPQFKERSGVAYMMRLKEAQWRRDRQRRQITQDDEKG